MLLRLFPWVLRCTHKNEIGRIIALFAKAQLDIKFARISGPLLETMLDD